MRALAAAAATNAAVALSTEPEFCHCIYFMTSAFEFVTADLINGSCVTDYTKWLAASHQQQQQLFSLLMCCSKVAALLCKSEPMYLLYGMQTAADAVATAQPVVGLVVRSLQCEKKSLRHTPQAAVAAAVGAAAPAMLTGLLLFSPGCCCWLGVSVFLVLGLTTCRSYRQAMTYRYHWGAESSSDTTQPSSVSTAANTTWEWRAI